MDYKELVENARKCLGKCHGCPICNGVACRNTIPGPGAKGVGDTAIRNYQAWQDVRVVMDTLCEKRKRIPVCPCLDILSLIHFCRPCWRGCHALQR